MDYKAKDFTNLIGMDGFSKELLEQHFTLYNGYVANTNKLLEILKSMREEGKLGTPEFAEVKRRLGWEFNGMRLHEYYFENLGGDGNLNKEGKLAKLFEENFGNYENWENEFKAIGKMRGISWVILYQDNISGDLINFWINEHDVAHPAGCKPILVMDVFEHAFLTDYGLNRADYIEAFFKNINWEVVENRLI
ncbi:superoxide dismutase [Hydrogenothermus marinus]|uniref:superoxide dismutase n=1 Tax=Hydrogenothermus marinus TaxID=133270 RepID=A0A3M0BKN6_9AQUI|nr:Fe-Mn family superoxide dismutase [Hydrogenothermus marinus]RMA97920.1 Fe-Mn family superoxide dismutase [Hydrogenothermus marinus]